MQFVGLNHCPEQDQVDSKFKFVKFKIENFWIITKVKYLYFYLSISCKILENDLHLVRSCKTINIVTRRTIMIQDLAKLWNKSSADRFFDKYQWFVKVSERILKFQKTTKSARNHKGILLTIYQKWTKMEHPQKRLEWVEERTSQRRGIFWRLLCWAVSFSFWFWAS